MPASNYDFTNSGKKKRALEQGATFSRVLTYKDANNSAIDLTGYTARMKVKRDYSSDAILTLTTENGRIALGGIAGTVTLTVSATDTAALNPGDYVYDLELVSGGGVVTRLIEGSFQITPEVTT